MGPILDGRFDGYAMKREELLANFRAELGSGDPDRYWALVGPGFKGKHWCGALCLYVLRTSGLAQGVEWEGNPKAGHFGFCFRLKRISPNKAEPGDIAYFDKFQHHAMVVGIEDGAGVPMLVSLDGNQGPPNRVREQRRRLSTVAAVYSIEPFLKAALDTIPSPPPEAA